MPWPVPSDGSVSDQVAGARGAEHLLQLPVTMSKHVQPEEKAEASRGPNSSLLRANQGLVTRLVTHRHTF